LRFEDSLGKQFSRSYLEKTHCKKKKKKPVVCGAGGVAQGGDPELKPQCYKKKKNNWRG
jgi:hypothetical protein